MKVQKSENGGIFEFEDSKKAVQPFEVETDTGFSARQVELVDDMEEVKWLILSATWRSSHLIFIVCLVGESA